MKTKVKISVLFMLFILISFYFLVPVEVEGVVQSKSINGRMSGNKGEGVLENRALPEGPWIDVENEDFEQFFSPQDKNAYINDSLEELLERKYVSVDYYVAIELCSDDPVNDVAEGETFSYFATLEDFNKVKIGDKVECKVLRYQFARIDRITVV